MAVSRRQLRQEPFAHRVVAAFQRGTCRRTLAGDGRIRDSRDGTTVRLTVELGRPCDAPTENAAASPPTMPARDAERSN